MTLRNTAPPIIVARKVDKRFGAFQALKGVSASCKEGEVTAIIGPSGHLHSGFRRAVGRSPGARI